MEHFDNLNLFYDPKPFWKTLKLYFPYKHFFGESKLALTEKVRS